MTANKALRLVLLITVLVGLLCQPAEAHRFIGSRRALLGAAAFSPTDISGLKLWLKADAGTWQDSVGGTPAASDSDVVGAWADQSGNGNDALQATTAKKPLLKLNQYNGQPALDFDGADDWMSQANESLVSNDFTYFSVVERDKLANQIVYGMGRHVDTEVMFPDRTFSVAANQWAPLTSSASGLDSWYPTLAGADYTNLTLFSSIANASNYRVWISGVLKDTHTWVNFAFPATYDSTNNHGVGSSSSDFAYRLEGRIAEILLYDAELSDADRQAVETYLADKYGITLS